MTTWHIDITMEALLVSLQVALLPSCYGLSRSLWNVNQTIAAAIIATSSFGFLFDVCIASSFGCSFIMTSTKKGGIGDVLAYSSRSGAGCWIGFLVRRVVQRSNDAT